MPDTTTGSAVRRWRRPTALLAAAVLAGTALTPPAAAAPAAAPPAAAPPAAQPPAEVDDPISHDPTIIKQGRYYYDIITGSVESRTYLPIRRSTDLVHWTLLDPVFTTAPAWVVAELGITPADFWAPDVSYFDGEYHLYYAASVFGTNNSVMGLATTRTLDQDDPDFGWVDRGMVLRSGPGDDFNAIDADIVFDAGKVPWMSFGSFWSGIKMRRLDARTGMLSAADTTLYSLASRGGASIEGPSVLYRGGYYYLFVSFDFCCRGVNSDYRVVVGRSKKATGPYTDRAGVSMMAGGGTELLRGYNRFRGTGHGDVFSVGGVDRFAHHYYDATDGGRPKLSVRPITWTAGWPALGDPLSGNRGVGHGNAYLSIVDRASGAALANPTCGYEGADVRLDVASPETCRQWRPEERGDGWSSLLNRQSNKVVEVAACVDADGARVAQWGWLDNDCQKFRFARTELGWSRIENKIAGRVLAGCAGAAVQTVTYTGAACQQFRLDPVGDVLLADRTGTDMLTGAACGSAPAVVVERTRRAGTCQLWRFVHVGDGYYRIEHRQSGWALTVTTVRGVPRVELVKGAAAGRWRIEPLGDGTYRLVDRAGAALGFDRTGVRPAAPGTSADQQVRILVP